MYNLGKDQVKWNDNDDTDDHNTDNKDADTVLVFVGDTNNDDCDLMMIKKLYGYCCHPCCCCWC